MIRLPLLSLVLLPLGACDGSAKDDTGADDTGDTEDTEDTDSGDTDSGDTDTDSGDTDTDTGPAEDIVIAGDWYDNWGGTHSVTNTAWTSWGSTYAISRYDNEVGLAIAQNGSDNAYNPGLWSRFDWGTVEGDVVYCQTAYDAASEEAALAVTPADLSNLESGCNGFSWTTLRAPFALVDAWNDSWGGEHVIDPFTWQNGDASYVISRVDDAAAWLVAQNAATNSWNPGLWSRFDWAWDTDGATFYCQTAYDAATEEDALAAAPPNARDLAAGCGGFSWTELRPMLSINGAWLDGWGGAHDIDAFRWISGDSTFAISQADDAAGWAVAQNGAANEWNPGLWSRFDWTWDGDGTLWYCQTAYAAADETEALATTPADPTDPGTTGCGGFSWTSMSMAAR